MASDGNRYRFHEVTVLARVHSPGPVPSSIKFGVAMVLLYLLRMSRFVPPIVRLVVVLISLPPSSNPFVRGGVQVSLGTAVCIRSRTLH